MEKEKCWFMEGCTDPGRGVTGPPHEPEAHRGSLERTHQFPEMQKPSRIARVEVPVNVEPGGG